MPVLYRIFSGKHESWEEIMERPKAYRHREKYKIDP